MAVTDKQFKTLENKVKKLEKQIKVLEAYAKHEHIDSWSYVNKKINIF